MRPPAIQVQDPPAGVIWQGWVAVPWRASIFALVGAVIGGVIGSVLVDARVIQSGSSEKMGLAVVGVLAGAIAWFLTALAGMFGVRNAEPPSRDESISLAVIAVGFVCAALILASVLPMFEDAFKDPRMFRLQRLIWLDGGLAASTCVVVAQRRLRPHVSIVLMTVIGLGFLAVAIWQFLPFLDECAPNATGELLCRTAF